jgi:hypothetical protein
MKFLKLFVHALSASALLGVLPCLGQTKTPAETNSVQRTVLEPAPAPMLNRIGLSYRMGLNFKVDFRNLGGLQLSDPGPSTGSAVNRNYDNGYNRVDISGNRSDLTWYWGYSSLNSAQPGSLVLQSDSTPATATSGRYQDSVQSGAEVWYLHEFKRGKHWRAGLEAGLGFMAVSIKDEQTLTYFANRTSDAYGIGPVLLPQPPYTGTFQGPGPLISSSLTPAGRSETVLPGAATITGRREVDSDLITLRLGPYLELPLSEKWSITLGGGLVLAVADTKFKFDETVSISDPLYGISLTGARSGSGWQTDFLVGGYAGANVLFAVSEKVRLQAGAMFQAAGKASNQQQGKQSVVNLGNSTIISVGAGYSF